MMLFRPRARPFEGRVEKRRGGLQVILALEEVKVRLADVVILVEGFIFDGSDAPHVAPLAHRQEEVHIRVFMEGMLLAVELVVCIHIQRRDPLRAVPVDAKGKLHKAAHLGLVGGVDLLDGDHADSGRAGFLKNITDFS